MSLRFTLLHLPLARSLRTAAAAACCAILASCSAGSFALDPAALKQRGLAPDEGYIVATYKVTSTMTSGKPSTRGATSKVFAYGSGAAAGQTAILCPHVTSKNSDPYNFGAPSAEVIAIPVKAGDYSIRGFEMTGIAGTGTLTVSNRLPMNVPFEVKPGKATYVGRMHSMALFGRNLLGFPVFSQGAIIPSDDFAEDSARIASTYPSIPRSSILRSNVPAGYKAEMQRISETKKNFWDNLPHF